jgi:hypothetical protein
MCLLCEEPSGDKALCKQCFPKGSVAKKVEFLKSESTKAMVVEVVRGTNELNVADVPEFVEVKVVLDSGAGAHVMNKADCPGYEIKESAMTKAGAAFKAANGSTIKNYGEVRVEMVTKDSKGGSHNISLKFEAADVTRALWSVGLICDAGLDVKFNKSKASVVNANGTEVCAFNRENGLYLATVKIRNPRHPSFQRPAQ